MPTATPFTAAISGLSNAHSSSRNSPNGCEPPLAPASERPAAGACAISERSCPAENAPPAPVITTARTPSSAFASRSASRSSRH